MVKNSPARAGDVQEKLVRSLDQEDPLEEGTVSHSSIFAWKIPRTEEPVQLQSMGSQSRTRLKRLSRHALLGMFVSRLLFEYLFSVLLGTLRSGVAGSHGSSVSPFEEPPDCLPFSLPSSGM